MTTTQVLSHLGSGLSIWNDAKNERRSLKDEYPYFAAIFQSIQTSLAITNINKISNLRGKNFRLAGWTSFALNSIPFLIAIAKKQFDPCVTPEKTDKSSITNDKNTLPVSENQNDNPPVDNPKSNQKTWHGRIITFGHLHFGKLGFVINCVSLVVMPILGAPLLLSVVSFSAMVYAWGHENWVPESIDSKLMTILNTIFLVSRILQGNWLERVTTCGKTLIDCYDFYISTWPKDEDFSSSCFPVQEQPKNEVNKKNFSSLITKTKRTPSFYVDINNSHARDVTDQDDLKSKVLKELVNKRQNIAHEISKITFSYYPKEMQPTHEWIELLFDSVERRRMFCLPESKKIIENSPLTLTVFWQLNRWFFYLSEQNMKSCFLGIKALKDLNEHPVKMEAYTKHNIIKWTTEFLQQQVKKEDLEKSLEETSKKHQLTFDKEKLFGKTISSEDKIKEEYILLLLLDWGVLRISDNLIKTTTPTSTPTFISCRKEDFKTY